MGTTSPLEVHLLPVALPPPSPLPGQVEVGVVGALEAGVVGALEVGLVEALGVGLGGAAQQPSRLSRALIKTIKTGEWWLNMMSISAPSSLVPSAIGIKRCILRPLRPVKRHIFLSVALSCSRVGRS